MDNDNAPFLPYGRQTIDDADIQAVVDVLRSDWLTTGPAVERFEADICAYTGARHGIAVSSGTAALHAAMFALGISKEDEVIVTPMTFAASANCVLYQGGTPVFADVDADTLLLDPAAAEAAITPRTKAIIAVDYAGQPCDWDALRAIADRHKMPWWRTAAMRLARPTRPPLGHAGRHHGVQLPSGEAYHHGEGGMAVTQDAACCADAGLPWARHHHHASQREKSGAWFYEMTDLGYNYRITDFQCALGSSQLKKLDNWIDKRNRLAQAYDAAFANNASIAPLAKRPNVRHAYHLYVCARRSATPCSKNCEPLASVSTFTMCRFTCILIIEAWAIKKVCAQLPKRPTRRF
jgi:dTDP-4-amino-4,6-dideoxygalactose transaminase